MVGALRFPLEVRAPILTMAAFLFAVFRTRAWILLGVVGFTAHANAQSAAVDSNRYVPSLGAGQWDSIQPGRLEDNGTFFTVLI